jgi:uncharacterized protein (TIGR02300 family)
MRPSSTISFDIRQNPWQTARQFEYGEGGMAKKEARGTKRTCQNEDCGSKFYDLNKDPIICPACQTIYKLAPIEEEEVVPVAAVVAPVKPAIDPERAEGDEIGDDDDALVSLEDADAELGADDDDSDDDTFLATDDEEDTGVGDLIGGVEKEEEET